MPGTALMGYAGEEEDLPAPCAADFLEGLEAETGDRVNCEHQ